MTTNAITPTEIFATDFAALAREIAMDIFPLQQILDIHRLDDSEWMRISQNPRFTTMLASMITEWQSALNTRERVRIKAATGLESVLENYIRDIGDESIPLIQRVEAGKFLARLGELDGQHMTGSGGNQVVINIRTGNEQPALILEGVPASGSWPGDDLMSSLEPTPDWEDADEVSDEYVSQ